MKTAKFHYQRVFKTEQGKKAYYDRMRDDIVRRYYIAIEKERMKFSRELRALYDAKNESVVEDVHTNF